MAKITNHTARDIKLVTLHSIPAKGEIEVSNDVIRSPDNWPSLNGMALAGQIGLTFDADPDPDAPEGHATQTVEPITDPELPPPEFHPSTPAKTQKPRKSKAVKAEAATADELTEPADTYTETDQAQE